MRIIVAECSVDYTGRGNTQLPLATRAIIIKADGAVSIHADTNGNKPLNYMGAGNTLTQKKTKKKHIWTFHKGSEQICVTINNILHDIEFDMSASEPGLSRKGTEKQVHLELVADPTKLGLPANTKVHLEFRTGAGQVDLLAELASTEWLAIEVKRKATPPAIDQIRRYLDALKQNYPEKTVHGAIAAHSFSASAITQAELYEIQLIQIPAAD